MVKQYYKVKKYKNTNAQKEIPKSASYSTYLVIVESPSKCKKIEEYLGADYCCISSMGHIQKITGLKSIDKKSNYSITFELLPDKMTHIDWMRSVIAKFHKSNVILASDADREGESIAWHICQVFDLDVATTKRILFHEITKPALLKAVEHPTTVDMNMVKAQQARQILDVFIGFKISPVLWKYLYKNKENSLSAGRCQTPALRLIHENELERKNLVPEQKYKVTGVFTQKKIEFLLDHSFENSPTEILDFLEMTKTHSHKLNIGSPSEHYKSPPKPFSTSGLLQAASSLLHIGPKEAMSICQQLYQDGYITYMRTESLKYSPIFTKSVKEYVLDRFHREEYVGNLETVENTDTANPHEAIRPTNILLLDVSLENQRANKLYKLIWKNTVESCMSTFTYQNVLISVSAPMNHFYRHTIEIPVFAGWKKLSENNTDKETLSGTGLSLYFKSLPANEIPYQSVAFSVVMTHRHSHYTEASLIKKLEDLEIGRPSTYAMIVDTNIEREYVKKMDIPGKSIKITEYMLRSTDKNIIIEEKDKVFGEEKSKLVIQPIGMMVADFLTEHFYSLFSYDYTKQMESELDEIALGNAVNWYDVCEKCNEEITILMKPTKSLVKQIFDVKDTDEYKIVYEKYGAVLRKILETGEYEYKSIRKDIVLDLDVLRSGGYCLEDLVKPSISLDLLEAHIDEDKKTNDEKPPAKEEVGSPSPIENRKIVRILNDHLSIRLGKYGAYIYYKTEDMTKPEFYNIHKFKQSYKFASEEALLKWIKDTYNVC
jgi:DNA topoisomerase-1